MSSENGEIYVFQWLRTTEKTIKKAPLVRTLQSLYIDIIFIVLQDFVKSHQVQLETTLLDIARGVDLYPHPGRPIRQAVARCFISLYSRGETRTLFDSLQALVKVTVDQKPGEKDARV